MTNPPSARRTTVHDLAELAGTSASTVSAVLNGSWQKRRISERLANHVTRIAEEQGYALNMQARALRRARSGIIGMILPMYDNRYFSSIAQTFEDMARARGLFPIVTCTQRDPRLELAAARSLLAYQVEYLVCTGATDPDRISRLCSAAGVPTINLDLPGSLAPSVISDNFTGARELTRDILDRASVGAAPSPALFIGGRGSDHNTRERLRGFLAAHEERGLRPEPHQILTCGYAATKAAEALSGFVAAGHPLPRGLFVNSTISLEGVIRWFRQPDSPDLGDIRLGCFDWDPFAEMLSDGIVMMRQDVETMLTTLFRLIETGKPEIRRIEVPPIPLRGRRA
ncbi:LacI family DNA-binding transcriptional regulator [Paracoccus aminophilus]|uniref:Transcriptional repressor, LacI femily n=1 Tax=Paracoccus aminophilus JCM 7686 TaxID=1367847 RepID=S5Y1C6_PARAH|nr:LacI family DNA-binding transcriptional regulator [Paracoccus aminophilus]AGT11292.1 transcriptional repressor, LacI femily [Paracoccus aminophilus JCM 7686]